ncbi:MAG: phosphatidylserine decarboxylase [Ktedonobacteraceae bacterium]
MFEHTLTGILLALITTLPLAWKWQLGVRRITLLVVLLALLSGLLVTFLGYWISINFLLRSGLVWLMTLTMLFAFLAYRFYRDPERTAPERDDVIVSPADGKVIYVRESRNGMLPVSTKYGHEYPLQELTKMPFYSQEAMVLGISMNFLDVHVNRVPIAGRIILHRHFPGRFGSLRLPEMVFENERATTVIEQNDLQVAVVQIASRLVRQIAVFVGEGQDVKLGQRFGVIRFGSQVDLVLPTRQDLKLTVQPGDLVKAGQTIIATFKNIDERIPETQEHFDVQGKR